MKDSTVAKKWLCSCGF